MIRRLAIALLALVAVQPAAMAANPVRAAFDAGHDFATGDQPQGLVLTDLRGTGAVDIVVANRDASSISVLLGNGDGTFAPRQDFASCASASRLAAADLDRNGTIDLVIVCDPLPTEAASSIGVMLGNGDGTLQAPVSYSLEMNAGGGIPEPYGVTKVLAGDLDGDGFADVVAMATRGGLVGQGGVRVLLNDGAGSGGALQAVIEADGIESMRDFALADLDGDGALDIAFAIHNTTDDEYGQGWAAGDGAGHFVSDQITDLSAYCDQVDPGCNVAHSVAVGDMDGDGSIDLVFSGDLGPCVAVHGGGGFLPCTFQSRFAEVRGRLLLSDLTGHGRLDIVSAAAPQTNRPPARWKVSILIGAGDATFSTGPVLYDEATNQGIEGLASADFNSDGLQDIAASFPASNAVRVWLNTGVEDEAPTAGDLSLETLQDEAVEGALDGRQAQDAALDYRIVGAPAHGEVELLDDATGEIRYTPQSGYFGSDSFTYRVNDGYVDSIEANVSISVHSRPMAEDDSIATTEGEPATGTLQGSDPGGNPLTFRISADGSKGTARITNAAAGAFTYTPAPGETGQDTFTFEVTNGFATAQATETVIISAAQRGGGGGGSLGLWALGALLVLSQLGRRDFPARNTLI